MGHEHKTASAKRKRLNLSQISAEMRAEIVKIAASKTRTHRELGELFNVRTSAVTQLASALKRSKSTIAKRRAKELKRSHEEAAIISVVRGLIRERCSIWNAKQVRDLVMEQTELKVSMSKVLGVMKTQLRLSYRKIKRVPFAGNLERNKVLRCLYAQKMLQVYQSGQRVINVDESWLPSADFRRRRWKRRGLLNSAPDKLLSQKINIITAMSSDGDVWISLTTCNTDSDVLMVFMTRFANLLTGECEGWRDNTILLLDGVSRHLRFLTCTTHLGLLPQVRREPGLL